MFQESQAVPLENVARVLGDGSPGRGHRRHSGDESIAEKPAQPDAGLSAPLNLLEMQQGLF